MLYRRFGRTGLQMPVFSCGGMRYQHSWKDVPPADIPKANQENLEKTIFRALELGINHIETARGYGSSEMQLGQVLPRIPREKLIVQTKVAPCTNPAEFLATFEKSMEYLRLDYVDLLSLHGINTGEILDDWCLRPGGCVDMARRLQKEGRVRHVGFSTHAPESVISRAVASDAFDYVNLHWYYIFQKNWPAIVEATKRDMGVFIISPNDKGGMLYKPSEKLSRLCQPLSPMAFNDLFCLLRPEVHTLSLGASKPEDFDEHVRALEHMDEAPTLVPAIVTRIEETLAAEFGPDWLAHYDEHLPSWEETPGGIHLREVLRLWTWAKGLDMVEYGRMRYNLLGNGGHWFPGSNAATVDDQALAPILARNRFGPRIPDILRETHALLKGEEKKRLSESN